MPRESEASALTRVLEELSPALKIASVTGPGGVGKSYLIQEVIDSFAPREHGFMQLSIDASNPQTREDFFGLIDGQLASRSLPAPARPDYDYFPQLRRVAGTHRALVNAVESELRRKEVSPETRRAVLALLRMGRVLNKAAGRKPSKAEEIILSQTDESVTELMDAAYDVIDKLSALSERTGSVLPGPIRDLLGITMRNRVRRDLYNFTADALCGDLAAALSGYRRPDVLKLTHGRLKGLDRLLIVLDDFEATAPVLAEFVVGSLLPRLSDAPFQTVVLIASRDDLEAIHPGFAQHARRWLAEHVELKSFDRDTAYALMREAGVPAERYEDLYDMTHGFPFLLSLVIEQAATPDADSALFARKLFDRTTRWMTDQQRDWFTALCYLDVVNEDTIAAMMDGKGDPARIQDWFEREASIREPSAAFFTVRPLIRTKCLEYFATRAPSKHRAMMERGERAKRSSLQ